MMLTDMDTPLEMDSILEQHGVDENPLVSGPRVEQLARLLEEQLQPIIKEAIRDAVKDSARRLARDLHQRLDAELSLMVREAVDEAVHAEPGSQLVSELDPN